MKINKDHQIINSLRISSYSKYNFLIENNDDCHELYDFIRLKRLPYVVIGEGTNIIAPEYFNGIVIQISLNYINNNKLLNVGASVNWNELVEYTIKKNIYGFENLSLIPGSVGAAPVQNIGAYGVEISSLIKSVECFDLSNNSFITINGSDCNFKYRHSCFKDNPDLLILSVNFVNNLKKEFNLNYDSITSYINKNNIDLNNIEHYEVAQIINTIRNSKLPDPNNIPNVGSFFKNPIIDNSRLSEFNNFISWPVSDNSSKLSAGQLISSIKHLLPSYKNVDLYEHHSLVMITNSKASYNEVLDFKNSISKTIFNNYSIHLDVEPTIIT